MINEKRFKRCVERLKSKGRVIITLTTLTDFFNDYKGIKLVTYGKTVAAYDHSDERKCIAKSVCHPEDQFDLYKGAKLCLARVVKELMYNDIKELHKINKTNQNTIIRLNNRIEKLNNTFKLNRKSREGNDNDN